MINMNGDFYNVGKQFSVDHVEVVVATVDLQQVRSFRSKNTSRSTANVISYPRIDVDFTVGVNFVGNPNLI